MFRTKRLATWGNVLGYLFLLAFAITAAFLRIKGLGIAIGVFLLIGLLAERQGFYQRVEIDVDSIRVQRFLGKVRQLHWSDISTVRPKGTKIDLASAKGSVSIYLHSGLEDETRLLALLAEQLPHLIHTAPPLTIDDVEPPGKLPIVARSRAVWAIGLLLVGLPFSAGMLAMGGLMVAMMGRVDEWWQTILALLMGLFSLAFGVIGLIDVVHGAVHKIRFDEEGVRLWAWWWSGYLAWTEIEDATVSSGAVRLCGAGTRIMFCPGYFAKRKRAEVETALQYYVVLHNIPVSHKRFLLP